MSYSPWTSPPPGRPAYSLILGELAASLKDSRIRFKHGPITVSGVAGGVSQSPDVGYLVPRRDLISATQILFDEGQLKIAEGLSLAGTLRDELLAWSNPKPHLSPTTSRAGARAKTTTWCWPWR